jgi:hypothetical protein
MRTYDHGRIIGAEEVSATQALLSCVAIVKVPEPELGLDCTLTESSTELEAISLFLILSSSGTNASSDLTVTATAASETALVKGITRTSEAGCVQYTFICSDAGI